MLWGETLAQVEGVGQLQGENAPEMLQTEGAQRLGEDEEEGCRKQPNQLGLGEGLSDRRKIHLLRDEPNGHPGHR